MQNAEPIDALFAGGASAYEIIEAYDVADPLQLQGSGRAEPRYSCGARGPDGTSRWSIFCRRISGIGS
ncbi:protein of unassigned function [Methylobacterium oryzae CBMB20]|uniref:Protein of unassigned function n=1 Tax=Methylobacterium oryzae CBMB20 TaxID=693986 RepID=A0A089NMN4_9HYPH|nr:protein of unassigned function [Methylobacterium oryzae CBMB20]